MSADIRDDDLSPSAPPPSPAETPAGDPSKDNVSPKGKTGVSMTRNIISGTLLVILTVIAVFEFKAYFASQSAINKLLAALDAVEKSQSPTEAIAYPKKDKVDQLVGQEPDGDAAIIGEWQTYSYTWNGLLRSYVVYVRFFNSNGELLLRDVVTNKEELAGR